MLVKAQQTLLFLVVLMMTATSAFAMHSGDKYLGDGRDRYNLFIFGDKLGGGLWAGMNRMAKGNDRLIINGRYREGSGLSNPAIYDWPDKLPKLLKAKRVDIAVFFIGSNDAQAIRKDGEILVFNSPEWKATYTSRINEVITLLKQSNTAIYWIELPPVSNPELDEKYKIVTAVQRQAAKNNAVRFISFRKHLTTPDGKYKQSGMGVNGYETRLRTYNGESFIVDGNNTLASLLIEKITLDIQISDGDRTATDFPSPSATGSQKTATGKNADKPAFGLSLLDGKEYIVPPSNLPSTVTSTIITSNGDIPVFGSNSKLATLKPTVTADTALKLLRESSSKNGPAHELFVNGMWPEPIAGRIDDFSDTVRQP